MRKRRYLFISIISFCFCLPVYAQDVNNDSLSYKNQKKIEALKNRIDMLYLKGSSPDSIVLMMEQVIKEQRDSIIYLSKVVREKLYISSKINPCDCSWIYYDLGKSIADYSKHPDLDSLAAALKKDSSVKLKFVGHADKTGTEKINQSLSLERAKNLKEYMVSRYKISPDRILTEGRGSKENIKSITDPNLFHLDRRVELYIMRPDYVYKK
jgi:hypothetical protein